MLPLVVKNGRKYCIKLLEIALSLNTPSSLEALMDEDDLRC